MNDEQNGENMMKKCLKMEENKGNGAIKRVG